MEMHFSGINWLAVLASVIAGQIISTVWFVVLFGEPWAKEYGASSRQEHTKAIAGYTYGVHAFDVDAFDRPRFWPIPELSKAVPFPWGRSNLSDGYFLLRISALRA